MFTIPHTEYYISEAVSVQKFAVGRFPIATKELKYYNL